MPFSISISISLSLCLDALVASCRTERRPLSHDRSTAESRFTVSLGTWFWEICSIGELDAFSHGVEGCCSARGCFQLKTKCVAAFRQPTTLALYGLYFSALSRCHAIPKYIRPNAPANICFVLLRSSSLLLPWLVPRQLKGSRLEVVCQPRYESYRIKKDSIWNVSFLSLIRPIINRDSIVLNTGRFRFRFRSDGFAGPVVVELAKLRLIVHRR